MFGYQTVGELMKDFRNGIFPRITEDRQIANLSENTDKSGMKTKIDGQFTSDLYMKANTADMHEYYLNIRKYHKNTCRDFISYFRRFRGFLHKSSG